MARSRKVYRRPVTVREALEEVSRHVKLAPRGAEEVPLVEAVGRVLAEDVRAASSVPPLTRSLMDGYAVIADDVAEAYEDSPVALRVKARVYAGRECSVELERGECAEVATGAPLPYPANAVVPVEYTREREGLVEVYRRVAPGENVEYAASDVVRGAIVAWKGDVVTPAVVGALAAAGVERVKVYRRPRVVVVSVGDELVPPGSKLRYGQVYDSNSHMVAAAMHALGAEVKRVGPIPDDESAIRGAINSLLEWADVVATIGGTSAGVEDLTYRVLSQYRPGLVVHGLRVKPGGPTAVAVAGDTVIVALPGFPLSCLTATSLILEPIVRRIAGMRRAEPRLVSAELLAPVPGAVGVERLVPVILVERSGLWRAYPLPVRSSTAGRLPVLNGYVSVPPDREGLAAGERVDVRLYPGASLADAVFLGSHCPLAETLLARLRRLHAVKAVYAGSTAGLRAVGVGAADVAGSHLYDAETGEYNIPFIRRWGLRGVTVVRGYMREQGFIMRPEHAGLVETVGDIARRGLRFVNRNRGSGTRVLVDMLIEREARERGLKPEDLKSGIKGYGFEVATHDGVALLVASGVADVGVGVRYVAEAYGLAFRPITWEVYDFVIRTESLEKPAVRSLLELLRSSLRELIEGFPGYALHKQSGEVVYRC